MTFTVKYRAKNGSVAEETIEAKNRSDCFAKCKSRGIVPMSVRDGSGKGKSGRINSKLQTKNSKLICFVAGIFVIVAGIWFWRDEEPAKVEKAPVKKVEKKRTTTPMDVKPATNIVQNVEKVPEIGMKDLSIDERRELRLEKFKDTPIDLTVPSNRVVATGTEQLMGWIFMTEVGDLPPPLPNIPDNELVHITKILAADNKVLEGDSEKTAEAKEVIQLVKQELKEFMDKGGKPQDFFEYYRGELVQAFETRKTARNTVMKVLKEEPEIALAYLDEVNKELEAKGIKKITLHPKQLKHFGVATEE